MSIHKLKLISCREAYCDHIGGEFRSAEYWAHRKLSVCVDAFAAHVVRLDFNTLESVHCFDLHEAALALNDADFVDAFIITD